MAQRQYILVALLAALLLCSGCTRRTITITSDPPGALVYLNDQEVGRTPVTVPFTFYGTYDVRLEREGYMPLWTKHDLEMPWWEIPGPDLVGEATGARSEHHWHFEMELIPPIDDERLVDRAMQMRAAVRPEADEHSQED